VPENVHETLAEAAALVGATRNQFVVQSAMEKAREVIESERILQLTKKDVEVFFEALENPPEPNEALKAAARRHMKFLGRVDG
jgi:uncharacterized protein (DUF1778 family)